MYRKMQESGLIKTIPLICTLIIWGQDPAFLHPESPQTAKFGGQRGYSGWCLDGLNILYLLIRQVTSFIHTPKLCPLTEEDVYDTLQICKKLVQLHLEIFWKHIDSETIEFQAWHQIWWNVEQGGRNGSTPAVQHKDISSKFNIRNPGFESPTMWSISCLTLRKPSVFSTFKSYWECQVRKCIGAYNGRKYPYFSRLTGALIQSPSPSWGPGL